MTFNSLKTVGGSFTAASNLLMNSFAAPNLTSVAGLVTVTVCRCGVCARFLSHPLPGLR